MIGVVCAGAASSCVSGGAEGSAWKSAAWAEDRAGVDGTPAPKPPGLAAASRASLSMFRTRSLASLSRRLLGRSFRRNLSLIFGMCMVVLV